MKFDLKYMFLIITLIFTFSVSQVNGAVVCCYESDNGGQIIPSPTGVCSVEGQILVSSNLNDCVDVNAGGAIIEPKRQGCTIGGVCYGTYRGRAFHDFPAVKNFFKNTLSVDLDDICDLGDYDPAVCQEELNFGNINTGRNDDDSVGGGELNPEDYIIDYDEEENFYKETEEQKFCSDAGGPFNLFVNKYSCDTLTNDGETFPCIYNPYLSGYIGISSEDDVQGLNSFENGCMPKSKIESCYDYKTKENCEENVLYNDESNELYKDQNMKSCLWIDTSEYFGATAGGGAFFDTGTGVCIANEISDEKHFNLDKYYSRLNLIKNPSFEERPGIPSWNAPGVTVSSVTSTEPYDGKSLAILDAGESISQDIYGVGEDYYDFFVYLKGDNFSSTDEIKLILTEYYDDGTEEKFTFKTRNDLSSFSQEGIFKKVTFFGGGHKVNKGTRYVNFKLTTNTEVSIDAINFEYLDSTNIVTMSNLFKQYELISPDASSCEACFDEDNFNTCTQKKSDLLGDCSYMVKDLSKDYISNVSEYLGKDGNIYLNDTWQSQSLANSLLFCELYLKKDQCLDENNFVNSVYGKYHYSSGSTLCKWDSNYGCYKDSDNSLGPDTYDGGIVFVHSHKDDNFNINGWSGSFFGNYSYDTENGKSDFEYSCDAIPPQSYVYFTGYDSNLSRINIGGEFPSQTLGNININLEAYDISPESCKPFEIEKLLFVDYIVNDKTYFKIIQSSTYGASESIKNFFSGPTGTLFTQDGPNDLTVLVRDQSGNIGKTFEYELDVDVNGPKIDLIDPTYTYIVGPLGPGKDLTFEISDYSEIKSCNYELILDDTAASNAGVESDFFDPIGEFDLENMSIGDDKYVFDLPIYDSTSQPNLYDLVITCEDIFGQVSSENYALIVDYDTSFILMDPSSFIGEEYDSGYLNGPSDVWAISVEKFLDSCSFDFTGTDGTGYLDIYQFDSGFVVPEYSSDLVMYSNVSGHIEFASNGKKDFLVKCSDNNGNQIEENITYFYDTVNPEILGFRVESQSLSSKTAILINGTYYTRRLSRNSIFVNNLLNVSIDGTISWPSTNLDDYDLNIWNGTAYNNVTDDVTYSIELKNNSNVGNLFIDAYDDLQLGIGVLTGEDDLYLQKYQLIFKDKAGNENVEDIEYYFDDSRPRFVFDGDLYQDGTDLYTRESSPVIKLSFGVPDYRKFSCSLSLNFKGVDFFRPNFAHTTELEFEISDVVSGVDLEQDSLDITFDCIDEYGFVLSDTFSITYDNTLPILNRIYLDDNGNNIYFANYGQYTTFDDIIDKLVFDFENTGEVGYNCEYGFEDLDTFSSCKVEKYYKTHDTTPGELKYKSDSFNLLSENTSSICFRDRSLINNELTGLAESNTKKDTRIRVVAECYDKVNLSTGIKTADIKISYIPGNGFVDFDIDYNLDEAYYTVTSLYELDRVIIALDELGNDYVATLQAQGINGDGLYVYTGSSDVLGIVNGDGSREIYAIGYDSTGSIWDTISANFVIDKVIPEVELSIPDANEEGVVYFDEFQVLFDVVDEGGSGLSSVKLYLNDKVIFNANNISGYNNMYLFEPDLSINGFNFDKSSFYGSLVFNGTIDEIYVFKVVAKDGYGNEKAASKTIVVKDGVGIRLLDSTDGSSKVNFDRFSWITKSSAPFIGFETSKNVEKCSISPFIDKEWFKITRDESIEFKDLTMSGLDGRVVDNKFYFDLSELEQFDLNFIESKISSVKVECVYNGTPYTYNRYLYLVDKLPDYVLESTQGFVLNTFPYSTIAQVRSVGPFKYISCEYAIDSGDYVEFSKSRGATFDEEIDFSSLSSGTHKLNILCEDMLGTKGPTKTYDFEVNKLLDTKISDVELFLGNNVYKPSGDEIYINELSSLGLRFTTNKKDVSCSYQIKGGGGLLGAVNFFKNLFGDNPIEVDEDNGFLFELGSGLDFSTGNKLEITCFDEVVSYDIYYESSSSLDFGLN